jgi:uncharacterized protein (TIGR04255 family)
VAGAILARACRSHQSRTAILRYNSLGTRRSESALWPRWGVVTPSARPKFRKPPVVEVVLGVQFEPLTRLQPAHVGRFWEPFRERFPRAETQPPLEHTVEQFRAPKSLQVQFELAPEAPPAAVRHWLISADGTELIQVQPDRLIVNWRRGQTSGEYPRIEHVRDLFDEVYAAFEAFLDAEDLGVVEPDQCEISYIDHIEPGGMWEDHSQIGRVIPSWSPPPDDPIVGRLEEVRLQLRYVIPDDRGRPWGRLTVGATPAYRRVDNAPLIVLTSTARGRPDGSGLDAIHRFFDRGHDSAVRAFYLLTSPAMHEVWEEER